MVVHHSDRLHMGIDDRTSDEAEAAFLEILRERIALRTGRGHLRDRGPVIDLRFPPDKRPDVPVEGTEFPLHCEEGPRVCHGGGDLQPIPDDAGVLEQQRCFLRIETSDFQRIESGKRPSVAVAASQNRIPRQAGLRPLENEHLKVAQIVMDRTPPLFVVVPDHIGLVASPGTAEGGIE